MNASTALPLEHQPELKPLKPMGLIESLVLFGAPTAALAASMGWLWPALTAAGLDRASAYAVSLTWVNIFLLAASVVGHAAEGNLLTWPAYVQRMRLNRITRRTWLWILLGTFFYLVLSLLVNIIAFPVFDLLNFTPPAIPWTPLPGWMSFIVLVFNIVGEELWWRGYILPRQELSFGKSAWLLHGILWACFHMYKWFTVPFMMLTTWVIPFIAQRTKNTWPGIISHTCLNSAGPVAEMIMIALKVI